MKFNIGHKASVLIDEVDYKLVSQHIWQPVRIHRVDYATTQINGNTTYMHRIIMDAEKGTYVDHINRNGLDNQRANLRVTTQSINIANAGMFGNNTTGYKGVVKYRTGWKAQTKFHQRIIQSNQINDPILAAILRDEIARQLFGDNVFFNIPEILNHPWEVEEAYRLIANQKKTA